MGEKMPVMAILYGEFPWNSRRRISYQLKYDDEAPVKIIPQDLMKNIVFFFQNAGAKELPSNLPFSDAHGGMVRWFAD